MSTVQERWMHKGLVVLLLIDLGRLGFAIEEKSLPKGFGDDDGDVLELGDTLEQDLLEAK
jgi:hypothetical protein